MKYLLGIILFVLGGGVGYWIAVQQTSDPKIVSMPMMVEKPSPPDLVKVVDSTIVAELDSVEKDKHRLERKVDLLADSLEILSEVMDSLTAKPDPFSAIVDTTPSTTDSFLNQEELILIDREVMVSSVTMLIEQPETVVETEPTALDSLKDKMNVKTIQVKEMTVEQWKSPLDFKGYRLSKTKLVLYGLYNELLIGLQQKKEQLYLQTNVATYALEFTNELKSFRKQTVEEHD